MWLHGGGQQKHAGAAATAGEYVDPASFMVT